MLAASTFISFGEHAGWAGLAGLGGVLPLGWDACRLTPDAAGGEAVSSVPSEDGKGKRRVSDRLDRRASRPDAEDSITL